MKVTITDVCIGCGACAGVCPEVFEIEGGVSILKAEADVDGNADMVRQAAQVCPVQAIQIEE